MKSYFHFRTGYWDFHTISTPFCRTFCKVLFWQSVSPLQWRTLLEHETMFTGSFCEVFFLQKTSKMTFFPKVGHRFLGQRLFHILHLPVWNNPFKKTCFSICRASFKIEKHVFHFFQSCEREWWGEKNLSPPHFCLPP